MFFKNVRNAVRDVNMLKEVRPPLKALLFAEGGDMLVNIARGLKFITILTGWRDSKAGQKVLLCCPYASFCVWAKLSEVRHTAFEDISFKEMMDDGFGSLRSMMDGLSNFYPDVKETDKATVIRWDEVEGAAVNNPDLIRLIRINKAKY